MRILIEGPNGSGKSSLADVLKDVIHYDAVALVHRDSEGQVDRYKDAYSRGQTIFVRGHISEYVYSRLYSRTPLPQEAVRALNPELDLIIYCRPSQRLLEQRLFLKQEQAAHQGRRLQETIDGLPKELSLFEECYAMALEQGIQCLLYDSASYANRATLIQQVQSCLKAQLKAELSYTDTWTREQRSFG